MWDHIKLADIYCRLSDEEKKHGNESESITNQRAIIRDYCEKHDIIIVKEFVDDGYSGGNFERPGFQAMLNHLSGGKVNMVITKDDCVIIEPTQKDLENQGFVAGSICF